MSEIILKHPFTASGKTLAKLELRRPTVKDLRTMNRFGDDEEAKEIGLIASLCNLVPEDLDTMDLADYKALQDSFRGMLSE